MNNTDPGNIWQNLDTDDPALGSLIDTVKLSGLKSANTIEQIKRKMVFGLIAGWILVLLEVMLVIYCPSLLIRLFMAVVVLYGFWYLNDTYKVYIDFKRSTFENAALLQNLKSQREKIDKFIKQQIKVSIFIFPFSVVGGFFYGGFISGKSPEQMMHKPIVGVILAAAIVVFTPIGYLLTKWMFKHSYSKYLKQISSLIDQLEETL
jgi:hypothetical protein